MKKDRQKLEDILLLTLRDYSNDKKIIDSVTTDLIEKGMPRGRVGGIFSASIPLSLISQDELCLFTKYLHQYVTNEDKHKINPEDFFNELELSRVEMLQKIEKEKVTRIVLNNVDQINDHQWLCTKETFQNISLYFENGLLTYNPNTQRQPLKRKVGSRTIEVINIDQDKIAEIEKEMLQDTFYTNAIIWNIRKITGQESESFKYFPKERKLIIDINEGIFVDIADGMHRMGAIIRVIAQKPEIDRVTSIYLYYVEEDQAIEIIRQQQKSTPISEEFLDYKNTTNQNMEVAKSVNSKLRNNEMFGKIGLNNSELKTENKLVTFDTMSRTIDLLFEFRPFEAKGIEDFLIEIFNIVIGINYDKFNGKLSETRENSYMADNNTWIGYIALGKELKLKYPDTWKEELLSILPKINFDKVNPDNAESWKKVGLENNINLSTIKKISNYFKNLS